MVAAAAGTPPPALARLAHHALGIRLESVPEVVARQARLCVLDTLGCMIAGTRTNEARLILDCEPDDAGELRASIPGTAHRRTLQAAIRINGYLGDVLELNDLIGGHASIGNVSAALALAESTGSSGAALLEAVIRGIEVTTKVYAAVYPTLKRYTEVAMVPVGLPSSIGAAAAAARLLELDEAQTLNAMAIAGGMAGWCPAEVIFGDGGTMKPLLFGAQPGAVGVTAAFYARRGMTGPSGLLDGTLGYLPTVSTGGRVELDPARTDWALAQPRRKLHACCGYLHSPVDATARLRADVGEALRGSTVEVRVPPYVADVVSKTAPPMSANDARFHLQYCLALVVCGNDIIRPEHSIDCASQLDRADIKSAMERIRVVPDAAFTHYHQCSVIFDSGSGRRHERSLSAPRGSAEKPLTDQEVVEKFLVLSEPVIGARAAARFVDEILQIHETADIGRLMRPLAV